MHTPETHDAAPAVLDKSSTPPSVGATMRAAARDRYGDVDVLEVVETETPTVTPATVLVRVEAAALNPLDWHLLTGTPWLVRLRAGLRRPTAPVLGVDFAGRVVAVGNEVADVAPGDEVVGVADGSFAQYVAVSPDRLVPKPSGIGFGEAAGMGVAAVTALQGLRDKGELRAGQRVLVNGASGGVGTAAVQLAKWMGGHVTAVCSARNVELVRSLGADQVIAYDTADFTDTEQRYHLFFDNQGNRSLGDCRRVLTDDGIYLCVGGPKKNRVYGPIGRMISAFARFRFTKKRARAFIAEVAKDDLTVLADLMASGDLRTIVDATYPLDEIGAAMTKLAEGHVRGKLIINP